MSPTKSIEQIVSEALEGQPVAFLEDVSAHGIHNITNDYHGASDEEYEQFADEFSRQANILLARIEAEQNA